MKTSQFVIFNLDCLLLISCCVAVRTIDSLSVVPVRYPVVQISSKLHIMRQTKRENGRRKKKRGEKQQEKNVLTHARTDRVDFGALRRGAGQN